MLLSLIVQSNLPFSIVKSTELKELLEMVSGREINIPSATTIMLTLTNKFNEMKDRIISELSQQRHVCITTDIWTHSARSYLGVSVHYFDKNWKHHSYIIAFKYLKERHTYDYLARCLHEIFNDFKIPVVKITHGVTDGGSNFCKAFKIFGNKTDFSKSLAAMEFIEMDNISDDEEDIVIIDNDPILIMGDDEQIIDDDVDIESANIQAEQIEFPDQAEIIDNEIMLPAQMRCFSHLLNLIGNNLNNEYFVNVNEIGCTFSH